MPSSLDSRPRRKSFAFPAGLFAGLLAWWLWMPLLYLLIVGLTDWWAPGQGTWHLFQWKIAEQWWLHNTAERAVWLLVGCIGTIIIVLLAAEGYDLARKRWAVGTALAATGCMLASVVTLWITAWDNDKDGARYYASSIQYIVPNTANPPSAIRKLVNGHNTTSHGRCDLGGPAGDDVYACITKGNYPTAGWAPRVSSEDGAEQIIARTASSIPGVSLDGRSMAYLNAHAGTKAVWSGVLDGSGRTNPMEGVAEWDGNSIKPKVCQFTGQDDMNRAVHGSRGNNLPNLLNDRYPHLTFDYSEYWGYCDNGNRPVIVFPVTKLTAYKNRLVQAPAGVVVMTGSKSGDPQLNWHQHVKAGAFPGPVYPTTLVDKAVDASEWSGGRAIKNNQKFGFTASDSAAQAANPSDYLLESATNHRLYWVTPLTPRYSTSQLFVAYSVTPADQVNAGHLNTTRIYVVADTDPRQINVDTLESSARSWFTTHEPGFFPGGGKLLEFIPEGNDLFRAYGEVNGRVVYRMDISATDQTNPSVVTLDGSGGDTPSSDSGTPSGSTTPGAPSTGTNSASGDCNNPAKLNTAQIASCLRALSDELSTRTSTTS